VTECYLQFAGFGGWLWQLCHLFGRRQAYRSDLSCWILLFPFSCVSLKLLTRQRIAAFLIERITLKLQQTSLQLAFLLQAS